jgi:G3E family GTPase
LHAHGAKMLRFKALLDVAGWPAPVVLDAVHHMIHPPKHLERWPNGPRTSRLVFIAQDLQLERIAPSLRRFLAGEFVQAAAVAR